VKITAAMSSPCHRNPTCNTFNLAVRALRGNPASGGKARTEPILVPAGHSAGIRFAVRIAPLMSHPCCKDAPGLSAVTVCSRAPAWHAELRAGLWDGAMSDHITLIYNG
jgi:hypothetical protein